MSSSNQLQQYTRLVLNDLGYSESTQLTQTLQGSIWRCKNKASNHVIKITDKTLHDKSIAVVNGKLFKCHENIIKEKAFLKYLTTKKQCPSSIVKYIDFIQRDNLLYLIMEDGGDSLFKFIVNAHRFICNGQIDISHWHKFVKIIFKQMMESVEYLHANNVCHMDISLENFLINDVDVEVDQKDKISFCGENKPIQVKICDFGLTEHFEPNSQFKSSRYVGKSNYFSPEIAAKKATFDARSNDIFCLGVCLFMMIIGTGPWQKAEGTDKCFRYIMDGKLSDLLRKWKRDHYVDDDLMELFEMIFKFEHERADMEQIKNCKWLRD